MAFRLLLGAWKQPDGERLQSFTVLTTNPNEVMERIHTRTPVILQPRDYARWLSRDPAEPPPIDLMRPCDADAMTAHLTENQPGDIFAELNSIQTRPTRRLTPRMGHTV